MSRTFATLLPAAVLGALSVPTVHASPTPSPAPQPVAAPADPPPEGREWVTVSTLPSVPGLRVRLGDEEAETGADGTVRLSRQRGLAELAPPLEVLDESVQITPRSKARLARVYRPTGIAPLLTFEVDFAVDIAFADRAGSSVDGSTVDSLQLKSSVGELRDLTAADTTVWLMGQRVVPFGKELQVKNLYWTVQQVLVDGGNVINRSQQRFEPAADAQVSIELLFFNATFRGRDAFFGFPSGSAVLLTYPDGHVVRYELGSDGVVEVHGLPRGQYLVTLLGPGKKVTQPVAVTRDQVVDLKLFSFLDVGTIAGTLLAGAIGLLLLGRRNVRRRAGPRPGVRRPARSQDLPLTADEETLIATGTGGVE